MLCEKCRAEWGDTSQEIATCSTCRRRDHFDAAVGRALYAEITNRGLPWHSEEKTLVDDRVNDGHPGVLGALEEIREMHLRKAADYGTGEDPLANVRASAQWGIAPWVGALVRAQDKVTRLQAAAKGSTLVNEGIEDSLLDLASYALISLALFREPDA